MGKGNGSECRAALVLEAEKPQTVKLSPEELAKLEKYSGREEFDLEELLELIPSLTPATADGLVKLGYLNKGFKFQISSDQTHIEESYAPAPELKRTLIQLKMQALGPEAQQVMMAFLAYASQKVYYSYRLEMTQKEIREISMMSPKELKKGIAELKDKGLMANYYTRKCVLPSPLVEAVKAINESLKLPWQNPLLALEIQPEETIKIKAEPLVASGPDNFEDYPEVLMMQLARYPVISERSLSPEKQQLMNKLVKKGYATLVKTYWAENPKGELKFSSSPLEARYRLTPEGIKITNRFSLSRLTPSNLEAYKRLVKSEELPNHFTLTDFMKATGLNRKDSYQALKELRGCDFISTYWTGTQTTRYRLTPIGNSCKAEIKP